MKILFVLLWLCLFVARADGAVIFDAISTNLESDVTTPSVTLTVGGGCANPIIVVQVGWYAQGGPPGAVSSLTIGGNAATLIAGISSAGGATSRRQELWYRVGVSTGSNIIAVTMSEEMARVTTSARSYCGVHQSIPIGTAATADTPSSTNAFVDVSSGATELVIDAAMTDGHESFTADASQTVRLNDDAAAGWFYLGSSEKVGAATTTMSWVLSAADSNTIIAVPLKPVATAAVRRHGVVMVQ